MKSNETLQKDVQDALKWEPLLRAAEIGVAAKDGVVTLSGTVETYSKKLEAEQATKRVNGVKAVVENIKLHFGSSTAKGDGEIAKDVLNALKWNWDISGDKVKVKVEDGWITLDGELAWNYQKESAKRSVSNLSGVKGVTNNITVKSESQEQIEQRTIESALASNWTLFDEDIRVSASGSRVTLNGIVHSYFQKEEAERIAWNAPGVWTVVNELAIEYN
jgi:osmotically-inducible protein OsmY